MKNNSYLDHFSSNTSLAETLHSLLSRQGQIRMSGGGGDVQLLQQLCVCDSCLGVSVKSV